jgi:hypothetical protein
MIGTPHTGKTTFLALFYLALINAKRTRLRLASWFGDREHLNAISKRLLRCTEAARTAMDEERRLDLPLETPNGEVVRLRVPDLSGELWQEALLHRQWSIDVDEQVQEAQGKLVFFHANEIDTGPSINAVHQAAAILGADTELPRSADNDEGQSGVVAGTHGGFPGHPPTQVDLVDLIQVTCEQRGSRPTRLCLIISAWDEATGTPGDFVATNLPLLNQYLEANRSWLSCKIFGVSAQGGRFDQTDARERLAEQDAVERAIIKTAEGNDAEIGSIVEWALGLS